MCVKCKHAIQYPSIPFHFIIPVIGSWFWQLVPQGFWPTTTPGHFGLGRGSTVGFTTHVVN